VLPWIVPWIVQVGKSTRVLVTGMSRPHPVGDAGGVGTGTVLAVAEAGLRAPRPAP
jgi:hypothetical protein